MNGSAKAVIPAQATRFDAHSYRRTLGQFTTGITIVTTCAQDGQRVGLTVNSFTDATGTVERTTLDSRFRRFSFLWEMKL